MYRSSYSISCALRSARSSSWNVSLPGVSVTPPGLRAVVAIVPQDCAAAAAPPLHPGLGILRPCGAIQHPSCLGSLTKMKQKNVETPAHAFSVPQLGLPLNNRQRAV
jgi:hypothetical protein